ncbi:Subtilisin-like protease SBT2.5 [Capsicum chinense]|nr:Subtilisin-like protease SBT2.5 [Capsicum chinense]
MQTLIMHYYAIADFFSISWEYCQKGGGFDRAGEDIVIGFIDSAIYPHHPSFASHNTEPYGPLPRYGGTCEIDPSTKKDYCNGKIIGAQHFSEAAKAAGSFNPAMDFDSPLDGDGHGRFVNFIFLKRLNF